MTSEDEGPILFAYDGSDQAEAAIRHAGRQLSTDREAIVLTLWQPYGSVPFAGGVGLPPDLEGELAREAEKVAERGARLARAAGFRATPRAESSSSLWRSILEMAKERGASIVVMGSHAGTGLAGALMGSVATTVSRHADRPVMIVHG